MCFANMMRTHAREGREESRSNRVTGSCDGLSGG